MKTNALCLIVVAWLGMVALARAEDRDPAPTQRSLAQELLHTAIDHTFGSSPEPKKPEPSREPEHPVDSTANEKAIEGARRDRFIGDPLAYSQRLQKDLRAFERDLEIEAAKEKEDEAERDELIRQLDLQKLWNRGQGSVFMSTGASAFLSGGRSKSILAWLGRAGGVYGGYEAYNRTKEKAAETEDLRRDIAKKRKELEVRTFRIAILEARIKNIKARLDSEIPWMNRDLMKFVIMADKTEDELLETQLLVADDKAAIEFLDARIGSVKLRERNPGMVSAAAGGLIAMADWGLIKIPGLSKVPGASGVKNSVKRFGVKTARNLFVIFGVTEGTLGQGEIDDLTYERNKAERKMEQNLTKIKSLEDVVDLFKRAVQTQLDLEKQHAAAGK